MKPEDINGQIIDISSIELDKNTQSLIYGKHYYGELTVLGAFEYENCRYIITKENGEWSIKQIIIDTITERKSKKISITENIIINLNNAPFSNKTIDNIKYYISKYGSLNQTALQDVDINLNNTHTYFYATSNNKLFTQLNNLKINNQTIPLNNLIEKLKHHYQI